MRAGAVQDLTVAHQGLLPASVAPDGKPAYRLAVRDSVRIPIPAQFRRAVLAVQVTVMRETGGVRVNALGRAQPEGSTSSQWVGSPVLGVEEPNGEWRKRTVTLSLRAADHYWTDAMLQVSQFAPWGAVAWFRDWKVVAL